MFACMMSTAFARIAEITEREITEAEIQVIPVFMITVVDEISGTIKTRLDPNAKQRFRLARGELFHLKLTIPG